jgi:PAS domain S-box-containing protein
MTKQPLGHAGPPALTTRQVAELQARLREAEETLDAIRNGDVDAVVVGGPSGQQVYTLENADRPYRVLIEQMQEGAVTLAEDGTVLYCNQRFATLAAARREAIIGSAVGRFFHAASGQALHGLLKQGPGAGISGEFTLLAADGAEVPVNISLADLTVEAGMPRVVCGVVTDLTHNRRRGDELAAANERLAREIEERRRAEESLRLALDAAGMASWDLDLATDRSRPSFRHAPMHGHDQLLPGGDLAAALENFVPDDRDRVAQAFAQAETSGSIEFEARIRRAEDDASRWLHVRGQTYYEAGKPIRIAGVVADITERRTVEEQLRQAQKMEAMGQLTGGVAHDFNNLLMVIGGSLDMLSRRIVPDERTTLLFDAARQGVARGARLNQQLLAFSRRQELRAEIVCIDDLFPTFEHLLDRAVGETVAVALERATTLWHCRIDPHQLETAILNLAINARDAMPEGGTLLLATENRTVASPLASKWGGTAGDYVVVSVADTGIGMPSDILAHAFEPFFTTKEMGKGTGLGLSQVYGFAKQSDGFVSIDSKPGQGTKVRIHLPRTEQPKPEAEPAGLPLAQIVEGSGVVLVVEDDPDVRATASFMLRDLGYAVREASTARAALALLESEAAVNLVFSDVIMPDGMSGIELARELSVRRPGLPVLLTSGYTAQRVVPEALASGLRFLRKPYTQTDLSLMVRASLGGRHH